MVFVCQTASAARVRRIVAITCLLLLAVAGCQNADDPVAAPPADSAKIAVGFVFEFGEGEPVEIALDAVPAGSTVADAMRQIAEMPGTVQLEIVGKGDMTFVQSINGKTTSGNEGWSYYVNEEWAQAGVGAIELKEGDLVRWTYGESEF
ncbi:hypothetical protein EC9_53650 [Rosistilla ulvae]|uniref:Transcobalamin-like C-terminal domain-containing protein n=1 Tax=Rosistilla ulvae TaxID=1930277 RepID=A0A517M8D2_9BACT|nr:DUF4430 domain-containing protein [Rosistilla ulvae]QDS91145.1 hypothetical protein EC9_53650 [Rosistilla ulvae]